MNFNNAIDEMKEAIVKSTQEIIQIKSVKAPAKGDMPFGEGVQKSLEYALNLAESFGFKTENIDNYAGHAEIGEGDEVIGILVHLDVVPEGDNWDYPPYGAEIHNGRIYGRGTTDDKGPAISAMYAMKALKDAGVPLNRKIRIIFGTDEESGWEGIDYYLNKVKAPDLGFTPDADFPAIHGEMGLLIHELTREFKPCDDHKGINIYSINGGNRPNMVPDHAIAQLSQDDRIESLIEEYNKQWEAPKLKLEANDNKAIVHAYGVSAHGSTPDRGFNAVSCLIDFLGTLPLAKGETSDFISVYNRTIGMDYNGQRIGCDLEDEVSGKLVFNVGVLNLDSEKLSLEINSRYPVTCDRYDVFNGMTKSLEGSGIKITETDFKGPIYMPKDHELIVKLMDVYRAHTGDTDSEPVTIGGGTYARAAKNIVAFGPLFPGEEELAHQRNEYIAVDSLILSAKIYADALYKLAE